MKKLTLFILLICICLALNAQTDTVFTYYSATGKVDTKELSLRYMKKYPLSELWVMEFYETHKDILTIRGTYFDKECTITKGDINIYYENGNLKSSFNCMNNQPILRKYFYPDGKLNGVGSYDDKGNLVKQEGYDTNGKIIKGYILERMSDFKGGRKGWLRYLQTHLKADLPSRNGAPTGKYTVIVSFMIGTDGKVTNATSKDNPGYGIKEEAIRIFKDGPKWLPAIENNQFVTTWKERAITFLVE